MERKNFLKKFAVGGSILFVSPTLFTACSKDDDIPDPDDGNGNERIFALSSLGLDAIGDFTYEGDIIIIRTGDSSYIALSKICTHEGCTVSYNSANNQLPCPCHGSVFSATGQVVSGPAQSNLRTYNVTIESDSLVLT